MHHAKSMVLLEKGNCFGTAPPGLPCYRSGSYGTSKLVSCLYCLMVQTHIMECFFQASKLLKWKESTVFIFHVEIEKSIIWTTTFNLKWRIVPFTHYTGSLRFQTSKGRRNFQSHNFFCLPEALQGLLRTEEASLALRRSSRGNRSTEVFRCPNLWTSADVCIWGGTRNGTPTDTMGLSCICRLH